jgi:FkbM family methyltransferase
VREFFESKKGGTFVEVGANEPNPVRSQTYHLENKLNWSGVLAEPIDYLYERNRRESQNATTVNVACTSPEKTGVLTLYIPAEKSEEIHGHAALEMEIDHAEKRKVRVRQVRAVTLDAILHSEDIKNVDLLSIDVEGTELDVLKGFSIDNFKLKLILLEDRLVYLNKHRYLRRYGYRLIKRTGFNSWYVPKEDKRIFIGVNRHCACL